MRRRWRTVIALSVLGILCAQAQQSMSMLVGTYTDGGSRGIYSYRFDQATGEATLQDSLALRNPSFLTISHDGGLVYAVSETNDGKASLNIHKDIHVSRAVCVQFY